ncbi:NaeI family type II restriction endonuclease [Kitasatospora phosalacinea]|uniref:NaeI family type II restriction endonuclease n=1 Tax=Kitasatospora phosalacinea TaxID=2065 RepID=UPI0035DECBA4
MCGLRPQDEAVRLQPRLGNREALPRGEGETQDCLIAGHEVDAKFSATGDWMITPKNVGAICLVAPAPEETSRFSVGLVRTREDLLRPASTRDRKGSLRAAGKRSAQ